MERSPRPRLGRLPGSLLLLGLLTAVFGAPLAGVWGLDGRWIVTLVAVGLMLVLTAAAATAMTGDDDE